MRPPRASTWRSSAVYPRSAFTEAPGVVVDGCAGLLPLLLEVGDDCLSVHAEADGGDLQAIVPLLTTWLNAPDSPGATDALLPTVNPVRVLLLDLDDTLITDEAARDDAMSSTLVSAAATTHLPDVWGAVRGEWRASGLRDHPAMGGVSSWEALWTDFQAAVADPVLQGAGRAYQVKVWGQLLPQVNASAASAVFREKRERLVQPYEWVPGALNIWAQTHEPLVRHERLLLATASQAPARRARAGLPRHHDLRRDRRGEVRAALSRRGRLTTRSCRRRRAGRRHR